jgi:Sulfotransferase domain
LNEAASRLTEGPAERAFEGDSPVRGVPVGVRRAVKTAVRAYAVATSPLRHGPDFLLVGAKRAGTTTLYDALVRHPDVAPLFPRIERIKSPHYFDLQHHRGQRWYRSHFPIRTPVGRDRITGDAAPYLLYHPLAPAWAGREVPDARVLVMLRDPVERAFSHHWDRVKNGVETLPFEQAVDAEAERLAGQEELLRADPATPRPAHEHFSYLDRGRYAPQLRRWLEHYPSSQVLVVRCEDFYAQPVEVFAHVCAFLGIATWTPPRFGRHHAHTDKPRVEPALRRRLAALFAEPNEDLARLLDTQVWWDADGPTRLDRPGVLEPPPAAGARR